MKKKLESHVWDCYAIQQSFKIMKIFLFIMIMSIGQLLAIESYSQRAKISLEFDNSELVRVLDEIENQSNFYFLFNEKLIDLNRKVNIRVENENIVKVLDALFEDTGVKYQLVDRTIVLAPEKTQVVQQQKTISGTVSDSSGRPLPGVSIIIKGTTTGTITDFDGNFSLTNVSGDATLVFSFVGMKTLEIAVANQSTFDIVMEDDAIGLEEVVAIGYGTKSKATLTGAIEKVGSESLEARPITNTINGLQGVVSGLNITRSSGQPGNEGYSINIRGASSINKGNTALILIDGVEGDLSLVNPSDIQDVSVLKDASAAIYGARAAGGVVLVTTKQGRKNQDVTISYNGSYSINEPVNIVQKLATRNWIESEWLAKLNSNSTPQFNDGGASLAEVLGKVGTGAEPTPAGGGTYLFYDEIDWEKEMFANGNQQIHNLAISGGGEKTRYNFSVGYSDNQGVVRDAYNNSERINLRMNYGWDITDRLSLDANLSYVKKTDQNPAMGMDIIMLEYARFYTWFPVMNKDGNYFSQWGFQNPKHHAAKENGKDETVKHTLSINLKGAYEIMDGLKLNAQVASNQELSLRTLNRIKYGSYDWDGRFQGNYNSKNEGRRSAGDADYLSVNAYLEYKKKLDLHDISVTVGASHEEKEFGSFDAWRNGYTQDALWALSLGDAQEQFNSESRLDWAIRSYFGRASYVYNDKYIAEFNFRRDGTSVFSPNTRWGNFTGTALAWRLSEENFIKQLDVFDNLKLRASRGTTGNQDLNEDQDDATLYDYIALIDFGGTYPFGDGALNQSASERAIVSDLRTWEDVTTTNIGIDFAVLNSRLSGSFDVFKKVNNNMLLSVNAPSVLGGDAPKKNIGELETKGWELSLNWSDKTASGFSYSVTGVLSDNVNELVDLDGRDQVDLGLNEAREGYATNTYFGYVYDGNLQTPEEVAEYIKLDGVPSNLEVGDAKYKDLNGDGKISIIDDNGSDADIVNLGSNNLRLAYSLNVDLAYKGFDMGIFLQGVAKRTYFYEGEFAIPWIWPWRPAIDRFDGNTWTPENTNAKFPRITTGPQRWWNYQASINRKANGAYMRVKNITLGYTLPQSLVDKVNLSTVRFYLSGEDLFTFDKLDKGFDAEETRGVARVYPFTRRFSVGVNVKF